MRLEELLYRNCRAGRGWTSETVGLRTGPHRAISHHGTVMVMFPIDEAELPMATVGNIHYDTGHGSMSDQQGMNRLFKALGLPLYY